MREFSSRWMGNGAAYAAAMGLMCIVMGAQGPAVEPEKTPLQPVLLELFTSEGCGNCPPADDLLSKLQGTETMAGQRIVVLSEHVTYWDDQGWVDPFSKAMFTARQNVYGERFNLESVYTPEIVVNGNWEALGNDAPAVRRALLAEGRPEALAKQAMLRVVSVSPPGTLPSKISYVTVTLALAKPLPPGAELYAVVADDMDLSQVLRGQNAGRRLMHVSVARTMVKLPTPNAVGTTTVMVVLPGTAARDQHLVLFTQAAGQGSVLSVASLPVPVAVSQSRFPQSGTGQ